VTFHFSGKVTTSEEAVLKRLQAVLKRSDIRPIPKPAPRGTWHPKAR